MSLWPLAGARVVDATMSVAGSLCAKLLAEAGAAVTRLRLPGDDPIAAVPPTPDWPAFLDLDKEIVALDPSSASGRRTLDKLLAGTHLLLTSAAHGDSSAGLDCPGALERHPHLLAACVTPFGQSGRYASYAADDLVLSALCGLADCTPGIPDRCEREDDPPVQSLAPLAETAGAVTAACAVFGPLAARLEGRLGPRHVEVAALEAAVAMMTYEWGYAAYGGYAQGRRPGHLDLEPNVYLPCRDGDVVILAITDGHWGGLLELMGNPEWAFAPEYATAVSRGVHAEGLHAHLAAWAREQRGREVLEAAQARGIPCAAALELRDALASEHLRGFGSLRSAGGRRYPADPILVDGTRRVRQGLIAEPSAPAPGHPDTTLKLPLEGVRVIDLGQFVAGPFAGQVLAALGADVILVESTSGIPISRQFGPFGGEPAHDASMSFNHAFRGKRSIRLDLKSAEARRVFRTLVGSADVVLENFSRDAAERLGITYDELRDGREDLILASISGFGRAGPWGGYVALHSGVILLSGLASVTRDSRERMRIPGCIYPDLLTGAMTALAVQEALAERALTGRGCHVQVSMLDVVLTAMGGLVPAAFEGAVFGRHPGRFLRTAEHARFLAVSGDAIEEPVQTARREAMEALQARAVKAAAVHDMLEVIADPHLADRSFVLADDHPVTRGKPVPAVPWLYDGVRPPLRHAPCLGEHTEEVLTDIARLSKGEVETLRAEGVLA